VSTHLIFFDTFLRLTGFLFAGFIAKSLFSLALILSNKKMDHHQAFCILFSAALGMLSGFNQLSQ
jgi:hypothetical protein